MCNLSPMLDTGLAKSSIQHRTSSIEFVRFEKGEIEQSIPDRFVKIVRMYPDRIAVKTRTHELTYDELNKAANRVARAILVLRGECEEPIALLLEYGTPIITGILGVLKSGKIYIPLDPGYPHVRNAYMLSDSQANLIVTDDRNLPLARQLADDNLQFISIDRIESGISNDDPNLTISPDSIAHILYTSGSTGLPKGVFNNHRNLMHHIMRYTNEIYIRPDDRLSLLRACSFNGALKDVFGSLLNGASLHPLNLKEEGLNSLANWLIQEEISIYCSVATTFRQLANSLSGAMAFPKLRIIYTGGEPIYKADVQLYKRYFAQACILVQGFGTSETGTICRYFIDKDTQINDNIVHVGYAATDIKILLLDEAGNDVSSDGVGEIAAKSRYLALGYWRRPEYTRKVFLSDPAGGDERIYLTGDLGRMSPDGCLIHLGRKDFQVKVRGHRIEVAEVETALLSLDSVKEAAVVALADQRGDQRLVAYIVPAEKQSPTVSELRLSLAKNLPDYMVPSVFVMLEAMPLTPDYKTDRQALPEPGTGRPALDTPFVSPRTPIEHELAILWSQVLGIDQVGIHDSFFDLGGHSLLATQVTSRVADRFQVKIPLKSLFQSPTLADMALIIAYAKVEDANPEDVRQLLTKLETMTDEQARQLFPDGREEDSHE